MIWSVESCRPERRSARKWWATEPARRWSHAWRPNDVQLWDNRRTMQSRTAADPTQPRELHRTLVKGEAIIAA